MRFTLILCEYIAEFKSTIKCIEAKNEIILTNPVFMEVFRSDCVELLDEEGDSEHHCKFSLCTVR